MKKGFIIFFLFQLTLFSQTNRFPGDVNGDNAVDILDIVLIVSFIIGDEQPTWDEYLSADINFDNALDILDIVNLVGMIINPADCPELFEPCSNAGYMCCDSLHPEAYTDCETCHLMEYFNTTEPPHVEQYYSHSDCKFCHVPTSWLDIIFSHTIADTTCNVCHITEMITANENVIQHNTLSSLCTDCHSTENWLDMWFQHDLAGFPLMGVHDTLNCTTCHADSWLGIASECSSCHLDVWQQTTQPVHETQIYSTSDCIRCHNAEAWTPSIFIHEPIDQPSCNGCHAVELLNANNNISGHESFPNDCSMCHITTSGWNNSSFDHSQTNFPLTDSHIGPACEACHVGGNYITTPSTCDGCHYDNWLATTQPDHEAQTFLAEDCEMCHTAIEWTFSIFEHGLPGQAQCVSCHTADFEIASQNVPDHAGYSSECSSCHATTIWSDVTIDHSFFPLTGVHESPVCEACHISEAQPPTACDGCHLTDYNNADESHHFSFPAGGYPSDQCELCHNLTNFGFTPSVFSHTLTSQACVNCHLYDFNTTTDPNHQTSGYSQTCDNCHATNTWQGADPHQAPVGPCQNCHNFEGDGDPLPDINHNTAPKLGTAINTCNICHTSTSNWSSINFGSNRHDGSTYQIYFNIYSGDHNGEWNNNCTAHCHVFGDFDSFSCYQACHEHSQNEMLDEHCEGNCENCSGSNGYWNIGSITFTNGSWSSPNTFIQCYGCHPDGSDGGPCGDD
ncbi:MAG: dockerin type I domain-containing protein [Fidelibacterota bacterium]